MLHEGWDVTLSEQDWNQDVFSALWNGDKYRKLLCSTYCLALQVLKVWRCTETPDNLDFCLQGRKLVLAEII